MANARPQPPSLYQETRISFAPSSPNTTLHISTGGSSTALVPFGAGRKRSYDESNANDKAAFERKHLATEGSVYFRASNRNPRSFLWRVLNERRLLELRCVDLVQDKHTKSECWLTFNIAFRDKILPNGVVLSDSSSKDELDIFVLSGDDLYTITLPRHLLARETAPADFDSTTVFKKFSPAAFTHRRPYRITAVSSLELFVSLQDGSLIRLERQPNENASQWRVTFFSEGGWSGTLKRTMSFRRQTVKFGDLDLDTNACAAIAKSPDDKYIWTVGLDHILRAWSTETGKIAAQMDMLHDRRKNLDDRTKQVQYAMGAEQGTLLRIVSAMDISNALYFLVLHSPKEHEFKFYAIGTGDDGLIDIQDAQPDHQLIAPIAEMLDTNIWHLAEFHISPGHKWQNNQLWISARSGGVCRTFMLSFDLFTDNSEAADLTDTWKRGWSIVDSASMSEEVLKESPDYLELDASVDTIVTPSEKWLSFLFYPGRFSQASLETALHIYSKGRNHTSSSERIRKLPLKERLTAAITSKILLRRLSNEQPDYSGYQLDLQDQWRTFFSLLLHIHARRHEAVGLAFDTEGRLPWTVCADFVAPVRASSAFELVDNNAGLVISGRALTEDSDVDPALLNRIWHEDNGDEDLVKSGVLAVSQQLRQCISPASQEKLRAAVLSDALSALHDKSDEAELQALCDDCAFSDDITNEDFKAIEDCATVFDGLGNLSDDTFLAVIEALGDSPVRGTEFRRALARFGKEVAIAVAQETIQRTQRVLLDLLALVVFMQTDLDREDLSPDFRANEIYATIKLRLRQSEFRLWLVAHQNLEFQDTSEQKGDVSRLTLYEHLFLPEWNDVAKEAPNTDMPELITAWNKAWVFGLDLTSKWEEVVDWVMSKLLKDKQYDLAADFTKFLVHGGSWTAYLQGRLYLATGEYDLAATFFRDAAGELSSGLPNAVRDNNAHLLDPIEINFLGCGIDKYYEHISSLFEHLRMFSYTAEFAEAALDNVQAVNDWRTQIAKIDLRKSKNDSPAPQRIDDAMEEIRLLRLRDGRDHVLNRLFNALKETGRFEEAYSALEKLSNAALQKSNLATLIKKCIKEQQIPVLLALPITGDLVHDADSELLRLAKSSMGTSNAAISGPPYHQILFAFRTQNGDFRGAAALLYLHLEHLKATKNSIMMDPEDETLVQVYVLLLNTLACCEDGEAWLLADPIQGVHPPGAKRRLIRLEDIRREYVAELDKRSDIEMGRFALTGGDEMDIL